jgi:hypothetical protein
MTPEMRQKAWDVARTLDDKLTRLWANTPWKSDASGHTYAKCSTYYGPVFAHFSIIVDTTGVCVWCLSEMAKDFAELHMSIGSSGRLSGVPVRIELHPTAVTAQQFATNRAAELAAKKDKREEKKKLKAERELRLVTDYQRAMGRA